MHGAKKTVCTVLLYKKNSYLLVLPLPPQKRRQQRPDKRPEEIKQKQSNAIN